MKRPLLMGASLLVLVGILVAAVALASQPARHTIHPTPALTVTAWFEYRRTVGGEAAEYQLRLANVGSASLTVSSGCYPLGALLVDAGGRRFRATPHVDCGTDR